MFNCDVICYDESVFANFHGWSVILTISTTYLFLKIDRFGYLLKTHAEALLRMVKDNETVIEWGSHDFECCFQLT